MIELSRMSMVSESLTQASRESARIGVLPIASEDDVQDRVHEELEILGLSNATIVVIPATIEAETRCLYEQDSTLGS